MAVNVFHGADPGQREIGLTDQIACRISFRLAEPARGVRSTKTAPRCTSGLSPQKSSISMGQ